MTDAAIVTSNTIEGVRLITVDGRVTSANAKDFETSMGTAVGTDRDPVVIDFGSLTYISSAGLRVLLLTGRKMKSEQRGLVLCNLQPTIQDVFDMSGLRQVFSVVERRADAVAEAVKS